MKRIHKLHFIVMTAISLVLVSSVAVSLAQEKIVAVVNNEIITQSDLDKFIKFMRMQLAREYTAQELDAKVVKLKADLLQRLIEDRLIMQEAKKSGISIDQNRIKGRLNEMKRGYDSEREFQAALAAQGMNISDLENKIKEQMYIYTVIENKVKDKIVIRPAEITEYYNNNKASFNTPEQRDFLSLVIETQEQAQKVWNELKQGRDIDGVSKDYALRLNNFSVRKDGELRKEIEDVVFSLGNTQISEPVKIDQVYYIFKVVKIVPAGMQKFDDVRTQISDMIYEKKMQEGVVNWLEQVKKRSYIKLMQ